MPHSPLRSKVLPRTIGAKTSTSWNFFDAIFTGGFAKGVNGDDQKSPQGVFWVIFFGAVVTTERVWDVLNLT